MYTQENRPLKVVTALGATDLLASRVSGVEGVSQPFRFVLELLSESDSIDADAVLRKPATIAIELADGETRMINGLVARFAQLGKHDDLVHYEAELVPWLWFLSLSRDCRIFQNLTVPEIVEQVFQSQGYADFDIRCTQSYEPREFCVQYRESHFDFVSRLMEEEGIFYFFEHTDSKHVLVLADNSDVLKPCPVKADAPMATRAHQEEDAVQSLRQEHSVYIGTVALRNYDELQPMLSLHGEMSGNGREEVYDYLGGFTTIEQGERYARLQLEAEEAVRQLVRGEGTCRTFQSGFRMKIRDHYRRDINREYLLLQVQHRIAVGDYRSGEASRMDYRNEFMAIPHDVPYHPSRRTRKPRVQGTQTALVVGKPGEEIWVDNLGRIKVQFYWDRDGQRDENSSCWVRVATPWGGKGWGGVSLPRIGNEVVVEFLDGDPDRPLVIGSVYNADQTPPFELPGSGIQMGMKSRSSPGGGGFNEITMSDTKGEEMVNIHAQYDMATTVENDQTNTIHNNRTTSVDVDDSATIGSNQTLSVGTDRSVSVGSNQSITVGADQTVSVGGALTETIGTDRSLSVGASNSESIGSNHELSAGSNVKLSSGADTEIAAGANAALSAGVNAEISAGAQIEVTAGATIKLSAAGSSIEIGPAGVTITSGALVTITGAMVKVNS